MSNNKSQPQDEKNPEILAMSKEADKVDVLKLSIRTGNRIKINGHNPHGVRGPGPMHRCADSLHGWSEHAHHQAEPMQLTESDYQAALKAAGNYKTHPAAIAPHRK